MLMCATQTQTKLASADYDAHLCPYMLTKIAMVIYDAHRCLASVNVISNDRKWCSLHHFLSLAITLTLAIEAGNGGLCCSFVSRKYKRCWQRQKKMLIGASEVRTQLAMADYDVHWCLANVNGVGNDRIRCSSVPHKYENLGTVDYEAHLCLARAKHVSNGIL